MSLYTLSLKLCESVSDHLVPETKKNLRREILYLMARDSTALVKNLLFVSLTDLPSRNVLTMLSTLPLMVDNIYIPLSFPSQQRMHL